MEQQEQNSADDEFLEAACHMVKAAQATGDERILSSLKTMLAHITPEMLCTVLMRYGALLKENEQLEQQLEQMEDTLPQRLRQAS